MGYYTSKKKYNQYNIRLIFIFLDVIAPSPETVVNNALGKEFLRDELVYVPSQITAKADGKNVEQYFTDLLKNANR